jgi:hypothetical protein
MSGCIINCLNNPRRHSPLLVSISLPAPQYWPRIPYIIYLVYISLSNLREINNNLISETLGLYLKESGHWLLADLALLSLSSLFYSFISIQQGHQAATQVAYEYLLLEESYTFPSGCGQSTLTGNCNDGMDDLEQTVSLAISYGQAVSRLATVVMIILLFRLFRYFRLQPELAIISNTLIRATPNICNLVFIMAVINVGFAQCAVFAWGADLDAFSSLTKASMTMFMILIGEFGVYYEDMAAVNVPLTNLFMVLYIMLCFIVAMNIFLAIVCDAYEEERKENGNYADDDTPGIIIGSFDQLFAMGHQAKRFMGTFDCVRHFRFMREGLNWGQRKAIKKLRWEDQVLFEKINWADISCAIGKIDKAKLADKKGMPCPSDIITAEMLASHLSSKRRVVSLPLARTLLYKYSREEQFSPTTFLTDKIRKKLSAVSNESAVLVTNAEDYVEGVADDVADQVDNVVDHVGDAVDDVTATMPIVTATISTVVDHVGDAVDDVVDYVGHAFEYTNATDGSQGVAPTHSGSDGRTASGSWDERRDGQGGGHAVAAHGGGETAAWGDHQADQHMQRSSVHSHPPPSPPAPSVFLDDPPPPPSASPESRLTRAPSASAAGMHHKSHTHKSHRPIAGGDNSIAFSLADSGLSAAAVAAIATSVHSAGYLEPYYRADGTLVTAEMQVAEERRGEGRGAPLVTAEMQARDTQPKSVNSFLSTGRSSMQSYRQDVDDTMDDGMYGDGGSHGGYYDRSHGGVIPAANLERSFDHSSVPTIDPFAMQQQQPRKRHGPGQGAGAPASQLLC